MAETVEETFESEVTRKTVRTSYKIEEVSTFLLMNQTIIYDEIIRANEIERDMNIKKEEREKGREKRYKMKERELEKEFIRKNHLMTIIYNKISGWKMKIVSFFILIFFQTFRLIRSITSINI